ncbi:MAG: NhaA family Na+:H+ antiporter [Verrucomicrobiales bacterium]|jgi:NhaA family Na+:H+ antiporter
MNQTAKFRMHSIKQFLRLESATGILLLVATALALICANSPLAGLYNSLLTVPFKIQLGDFQLAKPLLLWINDGLMAIFFFLVGLELKREVLGGELKDPRKVVLPVVAAIGGVACPAIIYSMINWGDPVAMNGWAIPAATDIAFALGILAMLGSRIPVALKIFLTSVAVIDDLGAIVIIALFYTDKLSIASLLTSLVILGGLFALNRCKITAKAPYILLGLVLWICVLKSGVHATLGGVALAMFIPYHPSKTGERPSPLTQLEHELHPWVAFCILPIFAFANAGVSVHGLSFSALLEPVPLGIMLGLFVGKQLGVFGFAFAAVKLGIAKLPEKVTWSQLFGVSMICGVGFTMSLFIGSLAFEQTGGPDYAVDDRLGILAGSFLSAVAGIIWLRYTSTPSQQAS